MKPTREQVLTWAREAIGGGALSYTVEDLLFRFEHFKGDTYEFKPDDLITFAALAYEAGRKNENEACVTDADWCIQNHLEHLVAERIRARMQP